MALSAEASAYIRALRDSGFPPVYGQQPQDIRDALALARASISPLSSVPPVREFVISNSDGSSFSVRAVYAGDDPAGVIVYFHGGGWVLGSLDESEAVASLLAQQTGFVVLIVGYRLAPEYPFPAAVTDAISAVRWTSSHLEELGVRSVAPVVVLGDSAGGTLATVAARHAMVEEGTNVAMQILVYPVTDHVLDSHSALKDENQLLLDRRSMMWFWDHYLGDVASRDHPDASPLRSEHLHLLPPTLVVIAGHDILSDQIESYVGRLKDAGVSVKVYRHAEEIHGFFSVPGSSAQMLAVEQISSFLSPLVHDSGIGNKEH